MPKSLQVIIIIVLVIVLVNIVIIIISQCHHHYHVLFQKSVYCCIYMYWSLDQKDTINISY